MKNKSVYIAASARTPIGSFGGSLKSYSATQLGSVAIREAILRSQILPSTIDEVYMGNVLSAGLGQAPARQAALGAGIPAEADATTINKVCSSGMKAITSGFASIVLGKSNAVVTGGMESMSNTPFYQMQQRFGHKFGHVQLIDGMLHDGLWDPYHQFHMGNAAELCVRQYKLTRKQQDDFAILSYQRALRATKHHLLADELVKVPIGNEQWLDADEDLKKVNFDKIPLLKPSFEKDGTITPANASNLNDGAAALVLGTENVMKSQPLARIIDYADAAQAPEWFTTSPAKAITKLLAQQQMKLSDIDLFEINEAYACVVLANARLLNIPVERININGGAVAMGHPIGASGARIVSTLITNLHQTGTRFGIAAICNGGGGASAILIERV